MCWLSVKKSPTHSRQSNRGRLPRHLQTGIEERRQSVRSRGRCSKFSRSCGVPFVLVRLKVSFISAASLSVSWLQQQPVTGAVCTMLSTPAWQTCRPPALMLSHDMTPWLVFLFSPLKFCNYIRQGGYCNRRCLFVSLSLFVSNFAQKIRSGFAWNF